MKALFFLSLLLIAIAWALPSHASNSQSSMTPEHRRQLITLRDSIRSWSPRCADGSLTLNACPFRDSLEYMGALCLSGEAADCEQIRRAQAPDGRFFRSPGFIGSAPGTIGDGFSNDMARGVFAYLIATRDLVAAERWMAYIEGNDHKLCPQGPKGWGGCVTSATFWTFARQVYDHLGLPLRPRMKAFKFALERVYSPLEARFQSDGYPLLLTAEGVLMMREMERQGLRLRNRAMYERIAGIVYGRDPENPFYHYVARGADDALATKLLKYCPAKPPADQPVRDGVTQYTVGLEGRMSKGDWRWGSGHLCQAILNFAIRDSAPDGQ